MSHCISLIQYTDKNLFELNPEAKQLLLSIDQTIPLAILSITGKSRTGKSYLLNQLLF